MRFNLNNFVMRTLTAMRNGGEDEYKVMQYALKYYERGVLTEENMAEIESWYTPTEEEPTENTDVEEISE